MCPVHDNTLLSWVYLGTVESIHDETPGGVDDLFMVYMPNYSPLFDTGRPTSYFELMRCWGRTNLSSNYKTAQWTGKMPEIYTYDPFFADLVVRARECGYPL